ncbi:MAG: ABC transporter permease [Paracoccaceae bacterium]|nr:ABC transporter permease [Paracoccaceae bacterium]
MGTIFSQAIQLIITADAALLEIVALSLRVTLTAVGLSCVIGLPIGAVLGAVSFPGRGLVNVTLNALMGLPPVVVGLVVYLTLSNSGPLGVLQLLYTPTAMIIAQTILVLPIVTALTRQMVEDLNAEYADHFSSLGVRLHQRVAALIWDGRHRLMTTVLAGFGRAIAEVGAVMIVGGNINHATRVMTTAIALESSKGNLELALALGVILLLVALIVNGLAMTIRGSTLRAAYA